MFRAPLRPKSFPPRAHVSVQPAAPKIVSGEWPLSTVQLAHPSHTTSVNPEDMATRATRFYYWHFDTALYDFPPPCVMMLYTLRVPCRLLQVCRYANGMGDALSIPLGTTAFVAGRTI
ncbi:hypothetical protein DFH08DRAFT_974261 [Mycena albidolilacea]|uniref:Uncharacterized protein n=1 Tax=Mycena albidolilacea TaxID=1033008 RepID=A0AAD7ECQ0_9AGAR|nr:hypothetical protein DFH08DRAFT_974261 [Mycena albidolilacea]